MVIQKEKEEKILKKACEISVEILKRLKDEIREGATPLQLDTQAGLLCKEYGVKLKDTVLILVFQLMM